ncbi:MAG: hypothetical protein ACRDLQ_03360 [Solirubrobacterales bacterium]
MALLIATGGCGGGDGGTGTEPAEPDLGTSEEASGEPAGDLAGESRPSRRDREVIRQLERHLRQEAVGVSGGWTFADVEDVQVRGTEVAIQTGLRPARRDAAASLCLAARRFFLEGGQGQTPYDVVVTGRQGAAFGRC